MGYRVVNVAEIKSMAGLEHVRMLAKVIDDETYEFINGYDGSPGGDLAPPLSALVAFADDISEGLIPEIFGWLVKHARSVAQSRDAVAKLAKDLREARE
jgi:hypothetical protein